MGVYIMMNGFLFRAFACIVVPFLMMASSVESYASHEDLVGKVKSEGACDDGFLMSGNIITNIGSRSQIHFSVETCC